MAGQGMGGRGRQRHRPPLSARLLADGERVWDVPAKLAARTRVFDTGHARKTDAHDAHAIVMVALHIRGLRQSSLDERWSASGLRPQAVVTRSAVWGAAHFKSRAIVLRWSSTLDLTDEADGEAPRDQGSPQERV